MPSADSADILEALLAGRRSVRDFRPEHPGRAAVERLVAAAIQAPSASNGQSWRFFVCDQPALIADLAAAVEQALAELLPRLDPAFAPRVAEYGRNFSWFGAAPVVVVPAFRPVAGLSAWAADADTARQMAALERHSALAGLSMAIQNLQLQAHAMGLASCCLTGPLIAAPAIQRRLGIAEAWQVAALIPLGLPAGPPPPAPGRKGVAHALRWVAPAE